MKTIIRYCSKQETPKSLTPSIQTFKKEIQGVIFEEDELEYQDMSILVALLRILASQEVNSDVEQSL